MRVARGGGATRQIYCRKAPTRAAALITINPSFRKEAQMQFSTFIVKDGTATLLAEDPQLGRVRFEISKSILAARLGVEFPSPDPALLKSCEEQRQRIEIACERAFQRETSERVSLMGGDFNDTSLDSPPQQPTDVAGG
jgi:hypothetical protein